MSHHASCNHKQPTPYTEKCPTKSTPLSITDKIALNLREIRKLKGISQWEAADYLGCSPEHMSLYENATHHISASDIALLSNLYKTPIQHFFRNINPDCR